MNVGSDEALPTIPPLLGERAEGEGELYTDISSLWSKGRERIGALSYSL